jgi:CheY-like chemotaxis protein
VILADILNVCFQSDPQLKHIHVIIQSGLSDSREVAKAEKLGAAGHLSKPYTRASLLTAIQRALAEEGLLAAA